MLKKSMPFLRNIKTIEDKVKAEEFPFTIPVFAKGIDLTFSSKVTFLVGENGSGKSTLMEALAQGCGFNPAGGNSNHKYEYLQTESSLADSLRFSWRPKVNKGFFMRAESFFNFASYIDELAKSDACALDPYGGKSLHQQSHGEAFLSLFTNQFQKGIYLLDEPEAALSPARQLTFLSIIHDLVSRGSAQFIIATHSPMILSYPKAKVLSLDGDSICEIDYRDTEHYRLTKDFLENPERYFKHLFE